MGTGHNRSAQREATHARLVMAFLDLVDESGSQRITVQQICKTAGVNRSTFYAHFRDIYDVVEYVTDYLLNELRGKFSRLRDGGALSMEAGIRTVVSHTYAHQYFYRVSSSAGIAFPHDKMRDTGYEFFLEQLIAPQCLRVGITDDAEIAYYATHFFSGLSGVMRRWLEGGCQETPETLVQILDRCLPKCLQSSRGEGGRLP